MRNAKRGLHSNDRQAIAKIGLRISDCESGKLAMMSVKLQFGDSWFGVCAFRFEIRNPQFDVPSSIFFLSFQIRDSQSDIPSLCFGLSAFRSAIRNPQSVIRSSIFALRVCGLTFRNPQSEIHTLQRLSQPIQQTKLIRLINYLTCLSQKVACPLFLSQLIQQTQQIKPI